MQCLDRHAPVKVKRVNSARLPAWYTPENGEVRKTRNNFKRLKQWSKYKKFRNKAKNLILKAKQNHFTDAVENSKDTSLIWKHLRTVNKMHISTAYRLPDELIINEDHFNDP